MSPNFTAALTPTAAGSADSHAVRYRPDIDGLRAIAVLSVIIYHLHAGGVAAGFLGVDMFFVLSGFLITSIIWREAQLGEFSIRKFYERRVRRILPALLVVLAVTTVFAAIVLLPADLLGYCKSLVATLTFVANFYFWRDADYFARASDYKPLLHMWSLGVEEQFYIFFPLLLALLARFHARVAFWVTAAITAASFALNVLLNFTDATQPAFFLLPARAWELGVGALLALLPPHVAPRRAVGVTAAAGLLLVLAGMAGVVPIDFFVPANGIMVVAGTALLVYAGRAERIPAVSRLLTLRPVVFIGLISYSLYLWHWPVFVLLRYYFVNGISPALWIVALIFIFVAAAASWHFVERPFRSKSMPIRRVVFSAASSAAVLAVIAIAIVRTGGLPHRFSAEAATVNAAVGSEWNCGVSQVVMIGVLHVCSLNLPSRNPQLAQAVLFGNSHAAMYAPAWKSIFIAHHQSAFLVSLRNGCLPTVEWNRDPRCFAEARRYVKAVLAQRSVRTVVIATTWWYSTLYDSAGRAVSNTGNRVLIAAIEDLDGRFLRAGKHVILIGPVMWPRWDVPTTVGRELAYGMPITEKLYTPKAAFMQVFAPLIRHFEMQKNIVFVPAYEAQCRQDRCYYVIDGHSLYADDNHLAAAEMWRLRPMFETAYDELAGPVNKHIASDP